MGNIVYIGTSLDGFIADRNGGLEWLEAVPNPDNDDLGWEKFLEGIDAIVMGRKTFQTVLGFGVGWPYPKKTFVLSSTLEHLPAGFEGEVEIINGAVAGILRALNFRGYKNLYIDGGTTIRQFLSEDLIDELIINRLPILLGGGVPLFGELPEPLLFEHVQTTVLLNEMVMSRYRRKK
ncbi:MAG: dihydrofolate reductase [Spirochaetales bacterium]|nr:dihydrofolate reductase [Spirochaetales bacterium]